MSSVDDDMRIKVTEDGPYLVSGFVGLKKERIMTDDQGESVGWQDGQEYPEQETYMLCRCGHSGGKPYCDSTHLAIGFDGQETADVSVYIEQAEVISGPELDLMDAKKLCSHARFCMSGEGAWKSTEHSDNPQARDVALYEAQLCPSGRLVAWDKATDQPLEKSYERSISLIEDPAKGVSGPIWAKGGIPVESADGSMYETRNRETLCRCGQSSNKPFCDGTHIAAGFSDEMQEQEIE